MGYTNNPDDQKNGNERNKKSKNKKKVITDVYGYTDV